MASAEATRLISGEIDDGAVRLRDQRSVAKARAEFHQRGATKLPLRIAAELWGGVAAEARALATSQGTRRELVFAETGYTPRRMRNVRRQEIEGHGHVIPALYHSAHLRTLLEEVAEERVLECPYEPEQYVISELVEAGDTHGWHWDDYSFALVWLIDCPPPTDGGFVQFVPDTTWNQADPQLHQKLADGQIHSLALSPGDLYLMRTDTTLHRVYPIRRGRRLSINMAYSAQRDLSKNISHTTMDGLWASLPSTSAGKDPR